MNLLLTILFMTTFALVTVVALLLKQNRRVTAERDRAEAHADNVFKGDDHYAKCRQLTAENAGLKCELTEAQDRLEETEAENKKLRLELWQERKRVRDVRKVLDGPVGGELVAGATAERAG